tara:strand:+ start:3172 stop:3900 length:729 start_codon:yes stop_codon:yes gene_type:complete
MSIQRTLINGVNKAGQHEPIKTNNSGELLVRNENIISSYDYETFQNHNGSKVVLTTPEGISVYADTSPVPVRDINERKGWNYQKLTTDPAISKMNYYFYSQGSHAATLTDLKNMWFSGVVDKWAASNDVPFLVVYTKPTGTGDAGAWFHSKIAYDITSDKLVVIGEWCNWWAGDEEPKKGLNPNLRNIQLTNEIKTGDCLGTEEILTISVHTDSSSLEHKNCINSVGWSLNNGIEYNLKLAR